MLPRAASRDQHRRASRILTASFAQLHLPWLAPAQLQWSRTHASVAGSTQPIGRRRRVSTGSRPTQLRSLATAAEPYSPSSPTTLPPPSYSAPADPKVWDFSGYGTSIRAKEPLVVQPYLPSRSTLIRIQSGLHATAKDLIVHLHTSLKVGRLDRAHIILTRMTEQCSPTAPELLYAHTAYLEHALNRLFAFNPSSRQAQTIFQDMRKWFEVDIRGRGLTPSAVQLVIMIRASLHVHTDDHGIRDRSVKRYCDVAKMQGEDILHEVLSAEEYTDDEFNSVGALSSKFSVGDEHTPDRILSEESDFDFKSVKPTKDHMDMYVLPEVLAAAPNLQSLSDINTTLKALKDTPELRAGASEEEEKEHNHQRQLKLEQSAVDVAIARWKASNEEMLKMGINSSLQSRPVSAMMWKWYDAMIAAVKKELEEVHKAYETTDDISSADRILYGPYLQLLSPETVAATTILTVVSKFTDYRPASSENESERVDVKLSTLTVSLGKMLQFECTAKDLVKSAADRKQFMLNVSHARRKQFLSRLRRKANLGSKMPESDQSIRSFDETVDSLISHEWPLEVRVKLGALLMSLILEAAQVPVTREHPRTGEKVTQMQPAFLHRFKYALGKKTGVILANSALLEKLKCEPVGSLMAKRMPMVVEPVPWSDYNKGGFLSTQIPIVRAPIGDRFGKDYVAAAAEQGDLDTLFKAVSALGAVGWKINEDIYKVQLEAWNTGEAITNFVPLKPHLPRPAEPEPSADPLPRRNWIQDMTAITHKEAGMHAQRCFQNFQLEVARGFLGETIYFPHNLDFRGRAYPLPPYLNHMGADNARALFTFAKGRPLGEEGLKWLKIHLATCAGFDKASMEDRVEFTTSHLDDIYDSVRNPLGGRKWWMQAEDAWQVLAACFELTKALDSGDPTKFVSHLPIQQDGTCNGLQHYAALGGDKAGAAQVNLEPGGRPADVYTAVGDLVKAEIQRDAEKGNRLAQKLHGKITRKCVKQPVMTNVYGVTFYGARAQVSKQLEDIFPDTSKADELNINKMASYVTKKIFLSLDRMFGGAQAIQRWLIECSRRSAVSLTPEQIKEHCSDEASIKRPKRRLGMASADPAALALAEKAAHKVDPARWSTFPTKLFSNTIVWTTPLRLPVVQPYRNPTGRTFDTKLQRLALADPQAFDTVDRTKQMQAFPPNFIHSLDATHMLLSALKCSEIGLTFASVHDSFWTHAADVGTMSSVLRDAFVTMHSEDITGRLLEELHARHKGCMYVQAIHRFSDLGTAILQWRFDNQARLTDHRDELRIEVERATLLNSQDPEEVKKGEAMVTPASIASEFDSTDVLRFHQSDEYILGDMPNLRESAAKHAGDTWPTDFSNDSAQARKKIGFSPNVRPTAPSMDHLSAAPPETLKRRIFIWTPTKFPPVPAKGDFDVSRLRHSKYFFH